MTTPSLSRASRRVVLCSTLAALGVALTFGACSTEPTATETNDPKGAPATPSLDLTPADLPLSLTGSSAVPLFEIKQSGGGIAGRFEITDPTSAAIALDGVTSGSGHALLAWNLGRGRGAVVLTSNSANTLPALDVSSQSLGTSTLAAAMDIRANNTSAVAPAASISTSGTGPVLRLNQGGASGDVAVFQVGGVNVARIDREGRGLFNGGTRNRGADVAEAFEVEGSVREYGPGDVLVVSTRTDRTLEKSRGQYSALVAGVYATRPGILLSEHDVEDDSAPVVPVGVVGVIPTKVSAENGAIRRGDLLVSAGTPGHAMRGTDRERMLGAVLGKALEEFDGPGTGVIRVLVNVK